MEIHVLILKGRGTTNSKVSIFLRFNSVNKSIGLVNCNLTCSRFYGKRLITKKYVLL